MQSIPAFYFNPAELRKIAAHHRQQFLSGDPFPHVVIDDFLPAEIIDLLVREFPKPEEIQWTLWGPGETQHTQDKNIEKIGTSDENKFGPFTRHFMTQLNSAPFVEFMEMLTSEKGLIPDPTFNGCGLHSTGPGGRLMLHTDTNRHPLGERLHQRYNLIFFLNERWKEEYGGHLELWDKTGSQCVKKILPVANRFVLFDTGTTSFHGHPYPLTCPPDRRRNSLAVYYYVLDRGADGNYEGFQNSVVWVPTTDADRVYGERLRRKTRMANIIKRFIPPVLLDIKQVIARALGSKE